MPSNWSIPRRTFLRGLGAAIALPFLDVMEPASRLLAAGAHDAWVTPIVMKKGRPAHTVHALCDPALVDAIRGVMVAETGTLGVRGSTMHRWPSERQVVVVDVDGRPVRVKTATSEAGVVRHKVEHDDAVAAADALGLPLRVVLERAQSSAAATR